jgi:glucokinase
MTESTAKGEYVVGVDLGATKIVSGVFDSKLNLIGTWKTSTKARRGSKEVLDRIARCIRDAVDECDLALSHIKSVGVGAPGTIDADAGKVLVAPNLGWKEVSLQKELETQLELPVLVENDCNLCTLAVHVHEFKAKPKHMLGIFLGTGIGGGLVLDGNLYRGAHDLAGEVGHMIIQTGGPKCACGNEGCFEALASRSAIFQRIVAAVKEGQKTMLTEMLGDDLKDLRSGDLRKAMRRGDKLVQKVIVQAAEYTGIAVANLVNIFNPELVVLGGGVIEALEEEMLPVITRSAREHVLARNPKTMELVASRLGDNAGMIGGALLARTGKK